METLGIGLGEAGLVGTFTACVDCFEYIRIGRSLGEDYQTAILKLDLARLRLTRWGRSVGITQDGQDIDESVAVAQLKSKLGAPEKDFETVQRTLGQIFRLFEVSKDTSKRLSLKREQIERIDSTIEDADIRVLHERMRDFAIQRRQKSSIRQKTAWVLYRKKEFTHLIEEITELISALAEVASVEGQQKELCRAEVEELHNDRSLVVLDKVLADSISDDNSTIDDLLREAVTTAIDERRGVIPKDVWKRNQVGEGSEIQQGDQISSSYKGQVMNQQRHHIAEDNTFGKNVTFLQGTRYG